MIALALAPNALWLSAVNLPTMSVADAKSRPFVVIPAALADDPKIAEMRKGGVRLVLSFDLYRPGLDAPTLDLGWFAQPLSTSAKPSRGWGVLSLDNDGASTYQTARAAAFAARANGFDGLVINVDLRSDRGVFRYGVADRRRTLDAVGLDPIDFDLSPEANANGGTAPPLPDALIRHLAKTGHNRAQRVVQPLLNAFSAKGKPIFLKIDPGLIQASPVRKTAAYGDWLTFLDLPGLSGLWMPTGATLSTTDVAAFVARLRGKPLPISVFGAPGMLPPPDPAGPSLIET